MEIVEEAPRSNRYRFTDEQVEDFEEVRKAPRGRAAVFVPEVQLVRQRKHEEEKVKQSVRPIFDIFKEKAKQIDPTLKDTSNDPSQPSIENLSRMTQSLRHVDDLDPSILFLAALLFVWYPGGVDLNDNINLYDSRKLNKTALDQDKVISLIREILKLHEKEPTLEKINAIKVDLISYYNMFFN